MKSLAEVLLEKEERVGCAFCGKEVRGKEAKLISTTSHHGTIFHEYACKDCLNR